MTKSVRALASVAVAALAAMGVAFAQTSITIPTLQNVDPVHDLFNDVVRGQPKAGNQYVTGGQISGTNAYHNGGVASTAFTYTFAAGEKYFLIQPAGTLATGTLTTEAHPGPGQQECFFSTQTQTALTWTANTGQTMDSSAPSAGVASTLQCIIYDSAKTTWYRIQ